MKPLYHRACVYELILEAVDAAGVVNLYLAYVKMNDMKERGMWLKELYISMIPDTLQDYIIIWVTTVLVYIFIQSILCILLGCILFIVIDLFICLKQITFLLNDALIRRADHL